MKLLITLKIALLSICFSMIGSYTSLASKPKQQATISVEAALQMAVASLRGKALEEAKKLINDRSVGGMTIAQDEVNLILNNALMAPPAAGAAATALKGCGEAYDVKQDEEANIQRALRQSMPQTARPQAAGAGAGARPKKAQEVRKNNMSLETLKSKITYVPIQRQGTNECGFRAVFCAKIISQLKIDQINTQTINREMQKFKGKICQRFISDQEVIALANSEKIKNLYVLEYFDGDLVPMQRTFGSPEGISEIIALLLGKKVEQAFFVINLNKVHWVLITVINPKVGNPRIFYLDSLNGPITAGSPSYLQLKALIEGLGI